MSAATRSAMRGLDRITLLSSAQNVKFAVSSIIAVSAYTLLNSNDFFSIQQKASNNNNNFDVWNGFRSRINPIATPALVETLQSRFQEGDYYVWLYKDQNGIPTSWEKYSVTKSSDGVVVIEMSTKFSEEENYSTHHRMTVNIVDHLESQNNHGGWRLGFEHRDGDKWKSFGPGANVQAFEEKFDIFSMLNMANQDDSNTRNVVFDRTNLKLIQSGRHKYTDAWYAPNDHSFGGVAILKNFANHSFYLIKTGSKAHEVDAKIQS